MATGQELSQPMPLGQPIESRDGTLNQDAKMVNCYLEKTTTGTAVVKRAGAALNTQLPAGTAQGMLTCSLLPYAIINDTLYRLSDGASFPIPGVTITGQTYNCLSDSPVNTTLLKSSNGLWIFNGVTVTKVTDANYPPTTLWGIVELDGTYYVMNNGGDLQGSALNDPTTWPALNFIRSDGAFQGGTGIIRHLNYLVALYQKGTQFYYDAGNSPMPIAPVLSASWTVGCWNSRPAIETYDRTYFLGHSSSAGRAVYMIDGMSMGEISTPYINRILKNADLSHYYGFAVKVNGHNFVVFTFTDLNITLVYDTEVKEWFQWTSVVNGVEQYFTPLYHVASSANDWLLEQTTGRVVEMIQNAYQDASGQINCLIRTPPMDWGTMKQKRFAAMYLHGDTSQSVVQVRYSDDDYNTYSTYRNIDLSSVRKMLQRCGRSRRRSWDFLHTANQPFRVETVEFDMSVGTS